MTDSGERLINAGGQPVRFENLDGGGTIWRPPGGGLRTFTLEEALRQAELDDEERAE
jgi:hypothetical protein